MKVLTVVGARPQFIKASVLGKELQRQGCEECLVHTGQHYDHNMSKVFFDGLNIRNPDHYLGVGSATHALQTAQIMMRLEPVILKERPDIVLVYGDTNSTLAGALVAAKLNIPVAHVEAGLRSFNRQMPEEMNRVVADHVSSFHFAPTATAVAQLRHEGIEQGVYLVGDLMVDLVRSTVTTLPEKPSIMERFRLIPGSYAVATIHRPANTDNQANFRSILEGMKLLDFPVIFPAHPRTLPLARCAVQGNVTICEPLPYADMIALEAHARVILTDSGGIQKEALVLRVPCVTLRTETEWVETLESGWNVLVGADSSLIARYAARGRPSKEPAEHYGDGKTAKRIVDILLSALITKKAIA
jgi:UDP-N-acetylglucosamine 2-epimerase